MVTRTVILGGKNKAPAFSTDFVKSGADSRFTTVRAAGGATYFDQTNTMQLASANTQRIDYGPTATTGAVTNWIRNSTNVGVVPGTPGTLPTNWTNSGIGLTQTVVGSGTVNGIPYVDIRLFGTNTSQFGAIPFEAISIIPAFAGQSWTASCYLAVVGGATTNMSFFGLKMQDITNPNDIISTSFSVTASLTRFSMSGTLSSTAPVWIVPNLWYNANGASGFAIDITLRIGGVQLETGATANTFVPSSGSITTVGAVPLGLLVEEARTNSIRNPRAEGAVVATPGTVPTNWTISGASSGMSTAVSGSGLENGIPYVDVRIFGTSTGTGFVAWNFEGAQQVVATNAQAWALSGFVRAVGGTVPGSFTHAIGANQNNAAGANLALLQTTITPTTASLASQRTLFATTTNQASIAFMQPFFDVGWNGIVTVDVTYRIGAPQLELGGFVTSPILPAIGTPAVTARAKDLVTMPVTGWFNAAAGTLACEVMFPQANPSGVFPTFANLNDATANNNIAIFYDGTFGRYRATTTVGGVGGFDSFSGSTAAIIAAAVMKAALAWGSGFGAFEVNPGSSPVAIYSAALTTPPGLTTLNVGADPTSGVSGARYIRKVRYWPRVLTNAEMIAATT